MKIRKPEYYDQFRCIAGACGDSCCIGWEIDINEEQKQVYAEFVREGSMQSELGKRMETCIDWEEGHFILQGKEERCPFLNQENLCDLIIGLGEDSLCDICREHPRFYDWFDGLTEDGLGLCCEAAGRLILEREEPVKFVVEECMDECDLQDGPDAVIGIDSADLQDDPKLLKILFEARETAIEILQNRTDSIWHRLIDFLDYVESLQEGLDFGSLEEIENVIAEFRKLAEGAIDGTPDGSEAFRMKVRTDAYRGLINLCGELEPIDESWPRTLAELDETLEKLIEEEAFEKTISISDAIQTVDEIREYEYEHLAVYFVYRYFMKCREDGDVHSKGSLVVFCLLLIRLLDAQAYCLAGQLTKEDRVQNAKCVSKEIEYSEENLETLADAFWEREEVSGERMRWMLGAQPEHV